jgi:hypothetical protein
MNPDMVAPAVANETVNSTTGADPVIPAAGSTDPPATAILTEGTAVPDSESDLSSGISVPEISTVVWDRPVDVENAPPEAGYGAAMVRDKMTGLLHISYIEYSNKTESPGMLIYQNGTGTHWNEPVIVDDTIGFYHRDVPEAVRHTSIALGPDGNPHIAYMSWNEGYHLKYARMLRPGEIINTSRGQEPAEYEGSGNGNVAAYEGDGRVNGAWLVVTPPLRGTFNGWGASVAVDRIDEPHFSFLAQDGFSTPVYVAYGVYNVSLQKTGTNEYAFFYGPVARLYGGLPFTYWPEPVRAGAVTSIALDSKDWPHICYSGNSDGFPFTLKHPDKPSGCGFSGPCYAGLDIEHVFLEWSGGGNYPWNQSGIRTGMVNTSSARMLYSSMAIDAEDNVHISSFDSGDQMFEKTGVISLPRPPGKLPSTGWDGNYSYTYWANGGRYGQLMYSTLRGSSTPVSRVVDNSSGINGMYSSIRVDAAGNPGIAYVDVVNGTVRYAFRGNGTGWATSTPPGQDRSRAQFTTLALDDAGNPQIVYLDIASGCLKYLHGRQSA